MCVCTVVFFSSSITLPAVSILLHCYFIAGFSSGEETVSKQDVPICCTADPASPRPTAMEKLDKCAPWCHHPVPISYQTHLVPLWGRGWCGNRSDHVGKVSISMHDCERFCERFKRILGKRAGMGSWGEMSRVVKEEHSTKNENRVGDRFTMPFPRLYRKLGMFSDYAAVYSCETSDWHH